MTQHLDMSFAQSFDASDWARSFVGYVNANPVIATDEATMIGWFANALMRGFDEANRRRDALPLPAGGETRDGYGNRSPITAVRRSCLRSMTTSGFGALTAWTASKSRCSSMN
jgi:hypothetical protein